MNTVSFTPQPDGQVRVTIHSEGERDQSALVTLDDFRVLVGNVHIDEPGDAPAEEDA